MVTLPFALLLLLLSLINILASNVPTEDSVDTSVKYSSEEEEEDEYTHKENCIYPLYITNSIANNAFNKEWEEKMKDFDNDFIYSISVPDKLKDIYYENVTIVPALIRGAMFTDYETKQKIEFGIIDPQKKVVYSNYTHQAIFVFNATVPGRYEIYFNNRLRTAVNLTITMNTGQNNMLKQKDLTSTEKKIDSLESFLKRIDVGFKINRNIQKERNESKS